MIKHDLKFNQAQLYFYTRMLVIILISFICDISALSCADIQEKGSGAVYTIEELKEISTIEPDDLKKCVILLGKDPLSSEQSSLIWNSFLEIFGSASDIPEEYLRQLGYIVNGIPHEHFANISLSDVDTISSFGKYKELTTKQLSSLRDAVVEQWRGKEMEDFTSFDLITLKQIICGFNSSLISMIHPESYKAAASELSTLTNCPHQVMEELANLATSPSGFGDASQWTSVQLANVGCIIVGLSSIRILPIDAIEGLTPMIINCLPPSTLQEMSDQQISRLSPSAASSLSSGQISVLTDSQKYALSQAIAGTSDKKSEGVKYEVNIIYIFFIWSIKWIFMGQNSIQ